MTTDKTTAPQTAKGTTPGMPAIRRGSMVPTPWVGFWNSLRGRDNSANAPWRASVAELDAHDEPWHEAAARRRNVLLFLIVLATTFACTLLWRSQPVDGPEVLHWAQVGLFGLLFAWVSAGCFTAIMGFWVSLRGDRFAMSAKSAGNAPIADETRTAVIMPICNEDVATVFAGLKATAESTATTGWGKSFDIFVLSDTNKPEIRAEELSAWNQLRDELKAAGSDINVYYRWRQHRTKKKAGNVADFCRRWGNAYKYMVVLDADSVMTGDALVTLTRLMEKNPKAGILQTAPRGVGHDTLHARSQQFASRVTGQLFTSGMQYWQLGESHYWGHNAIIRTDAFMKHCGLAKLEGKSSLAGDILSHDFVEAALIRRAGYQVWLVGDLEGSYEQQPPNLLAELQRDRRWCQGNMQNARLIAEPGLQGVHRAMLFTGAMAYASAPLWLAYVILGVALWVFGGHTMAAGVLSTTGIAILWAATGVMLILPRILGVIAVMMRGEQNRYGGLAKLIGSSALEAFLSVLQAPLRMAAHSMFVLGALTGIKLEWKSPPREAADVPWADAARQWGGLSLAVIAILCSATLLTNAAAWWLLPMAVPLALAVPFTVISSRSAFGAKLRANHWLAIPEEVTTPAVLTNAWGYAKQPVHAKLSLGKMADLQRLAQLVHQAVGARHTGLGLRGQARLARVQQLTGAEAPAPAVADQMRFLSEPHSMRLLHAARIGAGGQPAA